MIIGLVSSFDEGALASDAVRSLLPCCQTIRVLDGPIGAAEGAGFGDLLARVLFLLGFDAIFMVAAYGTYDFAIGE